MDAFGHVDSDRHTPLLAAPRATVEPVANLTGGAVIHLPESPQIHARLVTACVVCSRVFRFATVQRSVGPSREPSPTDGAGYRSSTLPFQLCVVRSIVSVTNSSGSSICSEVVNRSSVLAPPAS